MNDDYPLEVYASMAEALEREMLEAINEDFYQEKTREAINNLFNS